MAKDRFAKDDPEDFNGDLSAMPKRNQLDSHNSTDKELSGKKLDYGDMNLADAKRSGYTDRKGRAVEMTRRDRPGSPTGAFTDIGAGRSSVVKHTHKGTPRGH